MSGEDIPEQIKALRAEAGEARRLAAALADRQAITDLTLYADALEAELTKLLDGLAEPEADPSAALPQSATRSGLFVEHA